MHGGRNRHYQPRLPKLPALPVSANYIGAYLRVNIDPNYANSLDVSAFGSRSPFSTLSARNGSPGACRPNCVPSTRIVSINAASRARAREQKSRLSCLLRLSFSAYRGVATLPRPSRWTISNATSAGVIPLIRLACAKFRGRTRESFSRASARSCAMLS